MMDEVNEPCIFCAIVSGKAPASFVYRDDEVSAFLDIHPITVGHLLVIPNEHIPFSRDLPHTIASRVFGVARYLARVLLSSELRAEGTNIMLADGEAAGQDVPHAHLHVIPRFPGDGFFVLDPDAWRHPPPSREQLDAHAATIREAAAHEPPPTWPPGA